MSYNNACNIVTTFLWHWHSLHFLAVYFTTTFYSALEFILFEQQFLEELLYSVINSEKVK